MTAGDTTAFRSGVEHRPRWWSLQVFLRSSILAFGYERMMHTWWTWGVLWMGRLVAEISFFALIGRLVGSDDVVRFLLIGTALLGPAYATMFVSNSVRNMMMDGLVPYSIAAPAPVFPAALGQAVHWSVDGIIAGVLGLAIGNVVFGVGLRADQLLALIGLLILCPAVMTGVGLCLGALATRWPEAGNLLAGLGRAALGLLCGATFTVEYLPGALRPISELLPLTHLVSAARSISARSSTGGEGLGSPAVSATAMAVVTGGLWLLVSYGLVRRQFERSRRTGVFT